VRLTGDRIRGVRVVGIAEGLWLAGNESGDEHVAGHSDGGSDGEHGHESQELVFGGKEVLRRFL
jgi:hypothetical protein